MDLEVNIKEDKNLKGKIESVNIIRGSIEKANIATIEEQEVSA